MYFLNMENEKMLFHMPVSTIQAAPRLRHAYYEIIDPIKEALSSFQPQRVSTVENPLIIGDFCYYLSFQP